jgi:integrase
MSRLHLRYVQAFVSAGGGVYHYFRKAGSRRFPLPGLPGSAEFMAAYADALAAAPVAIGKTFRSRQGSISSAIAMYYSSQDFRSLQGGTPALRRAILEKFREQYGNRTLATLPREFIAALLDAMPANVARNWLVSFRHFIRWAEARKLIGRDPTWGIRLKVPKSDGRHTWSEHEIAAFEAHHAVGSKPRLALALGLYTGQRRGDIIQIGRQHIRDGVLTVRQQKTGTTLALPVRSELAEIIAATPSGNLTLLTTKTGKPYAANDFSIYFRKWCDAAGLPPECTFHGLPKATLTRLADAGKTVHQIAAVSGRVSLKEVERYTKRADQRRLAREALGEQNASENVKSDPPEVSNPLNSLAKKLG